MSAIENRENSEKIGECLLLAETVRKKKLAKVGGEAPRGGAIDMIDSPAAYATDTHGGRPSPFGVADGRLAQPFFRGCPLP